MENSKKRSRFLLRHCDGGQTVEKSDTYLPSEASGSITESISKQSSNQRTTRFAKRKKKQSITPASRRPHKKKTLCDRSQCLETDSLTLTLNRTLVVDLTSDGKDYKPFWNERSLERSAALWLPTKTGCVDSPSNCWNSSLRNLASNSWFSVTKKIPAMKKNCPMTFFPSSTSSLPDAMESEQDRVSRASAVHRLKKKHKGNVPLQHKRRRQRKRAKEKNSCFRKEQSRRKEAGNDKKRKAFNLPVREMEETTTIISASGTAEQTTELKSQTKCKRILLHPDEKQKALLTLWVSGARWIYNKCNEIHKQYAAEKEKKPPKRKRRKDKDSTMPDEGMKKEKKKEKYLFWTELRKKVVNNETYERDEKLKWMLNVPYEVRDSAYQDFRTAVRTEKMKCMQAKMKGEKRAFEIHYRSGKRSCSFALRKQSWKNNRCYSRFWCEPTSKKERREKKKYLDPLYGCEPLPEALPSDSRIQRDAYGRFFLCVPVGLEVRGENQAPSSNSVISLDPGVRTFMTGYDPAGYVYEWGANDFKKISRLCLYMDDLLSRINATDSDRNHWRINKKKKPFCFCDRSLSEEEKEKLKRKSTRALTKMRQRIRNLVDDLHHKLAKWLCENYVHIFIPKFQTSRMVVRITKEGRKRRISSKTARSMLNWSHYRFRTFLEHKAREYPWVRLFYVDEDYTSKTCGACGTIHYGLGGNKNFDCPAVRCHVGRMDRDANAARNILLKVQSEPEAWRIVLENGTRFLAEGVGSLTPPQKRSGVYPIGLIPLYGGKITGKLCESHQVIDVHWTTCCRLCSVHFKRVSFEFVKYAANDLCVYLISEFTDRVKEGLGITTPFEVESEKEFIGSMHDLLEYYDPEYWDSLEQRWEIKG